MSISDRIERAARAIAEHVGYLDDLDSDPQNVQDVFLHPVALARALDKAGLLAPAPLTEERGHRDPGGHVCTCGTDDPCPGEHSTIKHRDMEAPWCPHCGRNDYGRVVRNVDQ